MSLLYKIGSPNSANQTQSEFRAVRQHHYHNMIIKSSCGIERSMMPFLEAILLALICAVSSAPCAGPVCSYTFDVTSKSSHLWKNGGLNLKAGMLGSTLVTKPNTFFPELPQLPIPADDIENVVTLDGYLRDVIYINDKFPGPTIDVMKGVEVIIKNNCY